MFIFLVICVPYVRLSLDQRSVRWIQNWYAGVFPVYIGVSDQTFPLPFVVQSLLKVSWVSGVSLLKSGREKQNEGPLIKIYAPKTPREDLIPLGYLGYNCSWRRKKPRGYSNPCGSAYTDTWSTLRVRVRVRRKLSIPNVHMYSHSLRWFLWYKPYTLIGWVSGFLELYSGFQSQEFRIP